MPFPSPTMCGVDLKQQCSPAASSPVGAIGILSHEPRGRMRDTLRVTWLRELEPGLEARFVIRGAPLTDAGATCGEHETHSDIVFVNAPSDLRRENGPLLSFVLWLRCAMLAFPRAPFVGKADDDVWVAARWVHHTLSQLSSLRWQQPYIYVGGFEQYHWRPDVDAPARWSNGVQRESCRDRPSEGADHWLHGPFSFAKGALFLLSRPLATRLSGQGSSRHESRYAVMPRTRSYSPREHAEAITAGDYMRTPSSRAPRSVSPMRPGSCSSLRWSVRHGAGRRPLELSSPATAARAAAAPCHHTSWRSVRESAVVVRTLTSRSSASSVSA